MRDEPRCLSFIRFHGTQRLEQCLNRKKIQFSDKMKQVSFVIHLQEQ